jgi:hypothetical protein
MKLDDPHPGRMSSTGAGSVLVVLLPATYEVDDVTHRRVDPWHVHTPDATNRPDSARDGRTMVELIPGACIRPVGGAKGQVGGAKGQVGCAKSQVGCAKS